MCFGLQNALKVIERLIIIKKSQIVISSSMEHLEHLTGTHSRTFLGQTILCLDPEKAADQACFHRIELFFFLNPLIYPFIYPG